MVGSMIVAEIWPINLNDWRGQLRDTETGAAFGPQWQAEQRGALIGKIRGAVALTHLRFIDVCGPHFY